jgi:adenylate kinase family enzyme
MLSLEEQIDDIEKLHRLRERTHRLFAQAMEALCSHTYELRPRKGSTSFDPKVVPGWSSPGDDVEKAVLLRALASSGTKGESTRKALIEDLSAITLEDCEIAVPPDAKSSYEHVPVFRCALVMQALVEIPGRALSQAALSCFYRVVQELYEAPAPAYAVGAARAGAEAHPSAFITGECVRAILSLYGALTETAEVCRLLVRDVERSATEPDVAAWTKQHRALRAKALDVSVSPLRPRLLVRLDGSMDDPKGSIEELMAALGAVIITDVKRTKHVDSKAPFVAASHAVAQSAVDALVEIVKKIKNIDGKFGPVKTGTDLASLLDGAASGVRRLLDPVERYASRLIDHELAATSSYLNREVDARELVFAAAMFGRLVHPNGAPWNHPKLRAALNLATALLKDDGRLPGARPIDILPKGYRLHVASLEVTRRLAELVAHIEVEPDPGLLYQLVGIFEDTRGVSLDGTQPGWTTDPAGPDRQSEWWVTALAAETLTHVNRMLDADINRRILKHFSVRPPTELEISLEKLFYPDYGLAAVGQNGPSVAIKLQRMRAHIQGVGSKDEDLYSIILYGPPGTGKTTLAEALANSANVPLVEVTPSDILVGGAEAVERRTRLVFGALAMLTKAVIFFDEFDSILKDRGAKDDEIKQVESVFAFLTPGMLPKLKKLHDAAKRQQVVYALATNYVYRLDDAAIREGRFDDKHGIYPPDVLSRLGRLLEQYKPWTKNHIHPDRIIEALKTTARGPMGTLGKPGWFTAPTGETARAKTLFAYLETGKDCPTVTSEANFDSERANKAKAPLEKQYWETWQTVDDWEKKLESATAVPSVNWNEFLETLMGKLP